MNLTIKIERPEFSKVQHDKMCLVVEFPNCYSTTTGKPFKWMPTYQQLRDLSKCLEAIERISWNDKNEKEKNCCNTQTSSG